MTTANKQRQAVLKMTQAVRYALDEFGKIPIPPAGATMRAYQQLADAEQAIDEAFSFQYYESDDE